MFSTAHSSASSLIPHIVEGRETKKAKSSRRRRIHTGVAAGLGLERAAANLLSPQVLAEFCCGCMLGGADGFDEKTKTACLCVLTHFLTTETI